MKRWTTFPMYIVLILFFTLEIFAQQPSITKQPQAQGVIVGQTATFSVISQGDTLSYQWFKDGALIPSATDSFYTTPATIITDNGSVFSVKVTNSSGSDSSNGAILYVTDSGSRVTAGEQVLYDFNDGTGNVVHDVSGVGTPLDLTINKPENVLWSPVGLHIKDTALINSSIATKVINSVVANNELSIEMWIKPKANDGNYRIFNLTKSDTEVNFGVEALKSKDGYNFVVRTTTTNNQGIPGIADSSGIGTNLTHLVFTHSSDGISKTYKNGIEVKVDSIGGNLSNWDSQARLSLTSFLNGGSTTWKGIFYSAAIYSRALDSVEVAHNFSLGTEVEEAPFITEQPQNKKILEGFTTTFNNVKAIGNAPFSYQWMKNGVDIAGATDSSYTTPPVSLADSGSSFMVVVSNSNGSDTSRAAILQVVKGAIEACAPGIVHYYHLDDSTSPYIDSFGFTDGISSNPPSIDSGIVGSSQKFTGSEEIDIPDDDLTDWKADESFSIEFWMKTNHIPSDVNVAVGRTNPSTGLQWWVGYDTNGKVGFFLRNANSESSSIGSDTTVNDNKWHLIAAVRDGATNTNYLYVDGNKVDSVVQSYSTGFESSEKITVGYLNQPSFYHYNGLLDELAIYNAALSPVEIQKHYDNGLSGKGYCGEINAPSDLAASLNAQDSSKVDLNWVDNSSNEDGFIIERKINTPIPSAFSVLDSVSSDVTNYTDINVSDTISYTYRVKAFNSFTESSFSNEATIMTLLFSIGAPTNLTAMLNAPDSNKVELNWTDNSSNETGFVIQRKVGDSTSSNTFVLLDSVSANVTSFSDSSISDTTLYSYRIYAFNEDTTSDYSNVATVTSILLTISTPTDLKAELSAQDSFKVNLTWTDNSSNENGFVIERKTGDTSSVNPFNVVDTVAANQTAFTDSTVSDSTTYTYRVYAFNNDTTSLMSNAAQVTTPVITGIKSFNQIPKEFALDQNYPNPFNPSTIIRYALPMNAKVTIKLYNTLGQEITKIFDGELNAGIHEVNFNASNLSSGVYFYRLSAKGVNGSNFVSTKRMILLK